MTRKQCFETTCTEKSVWQSALEGKTPRSGCNLCSSSVLSLVPGQHGGISLASSSPTNPRHSWCCQQRPLRCSSQQRRGVSSPESCSKSISGWVMGCLSPTALPTAGSFQPPALPRSTLCPALYPCPVLGTGPRNPSDTSQPKETPKAPAPAQQQHRGGGCCLQDVAEKQPGHPHK